jgi:L-threonylcarbamoyladenylate synthase
VTPVVDVLAELRAERPIVIPTETVYGIAARPTAAGIDALFRLKRRPSTKPIPMLGHDVAALSGVVVFDDRARRLATRFWPGPLTLVLPRAEGFTADLGGNGAAGIAVRVPADDLALEILRAAGVLAVTSANPSGEEPVSTVAAARAAFGGGVRIYVDGGPRTGHPSTIVSLIDAPQLLRPGPVGRDEVLDCLGGRGL